jgi:antitoxin component YwqK of YwqJK toxin-antitoxin module
MKKLFLLILIIAAPLFCNGQKKVNEYQCDINFKDVIEKRGLIYFKVDTSLVTGRMVQYNKKNVAKKYMYVLNGKPDNLGWVRYKDKVELPKASVTGTLLSIPLLYSGNDDYINYSQENRNDNLTLYNRIIKADTYISNQKENTSKAYDEMLERNDIYNQQISIKEIINGPMVEYYKEGQIKTTGHYKNGFLSGECKQFYQTGELHKTLNYENGKLTGVFKEFYQTGQLKESGNFINGVQVGVKKTYYDTGELQSVEYFKNGQPMRDSKYFDKKRNLIGN